MSERTTFPRDFPRAAAAVDQVLAEHEEQKRQEWKRRDWIVHAHAARLHIEGAFNAPSDEELVDLSHAATRAVMALETYLAAKEKA